MWSGKNPLPCSFSTRVRVFAVQSIRQSDATKSFLNIFLMLASIRLDMSAKGLLDRDRQHRVTIFITFAGSNDDLVASKVDSFDPEMTALHQPQSTAVE